MTTTYDPAYIAEQLKFLRKHYRLTQANVADLTGLTTRTIEKLESGRHSPNLQTMRSLCRGLRIDESYFIKPLPEQEVATKRSLERALRSTIIVPLTPVMTVEDVASAMDGFDGWRMDGALVTDDGAKADVAVVFDLIFDYSEVWDDIGHVGRHEAVKTIYDAAKELEAAGCRLHLGNYRQVHRSAKPTLRFRYGLAVVLTMKDHGEMRHAVVTLEEPWEAHLDDRLSLGE